MDIRKRLEVFGNTKELAELLYRRTRTSPDELLAECRDTLLVMFSDLHEAADEIERLTRALHSKAEALMMQTNEIDRLRRTLFDHMEALRFQNDYNDELKKELEVERMRLAACGTAALGYFNGCADEYRSASLDDVLGLREQLAACMKDAERYRHWRNNYPKNFAPTDLTPEDVDRLTDAAIDAAMKEKP